MDPSNTTTMGAFCTVTTDASRIDVYKGSQTEKRKRNMRAGGARKLHLPIKKRVARLRCAFAGTTFNGERLRGLSAVGQPGYWRCGYLDGCFLGTGVPSTTVPAYYPVPLPLVPSEPY